MLRLTAIGNGQFAQMLRALNIRAETITNTIFGIVAGIVEYTPKPYSDSS